MSYEQLMQHAHDIQQKAIQKKVDEQGLNLVRPDDGGYDLLGRVNPRIQQEFSDIPDRFLPFTEMPDPTSFDSSIDEMAGAVSKLYRGQEDPHHGKIDRDVMVANPVLDKMSGSESYIEKWTGQAAMAFKSTFIDPFPSIVSNQFTMAGVLKAGMEANQAMWKSVRDDIDLIAHKTLEALDHMDDCDPTEWTVTFSVLSSIAYVGAVAVPPLGLTLTVVGAATSVIAGVPPDDPPSNSFSGDTTDQVIASMRDAITKLMRHISEVENQISRSLDNAHRVLIEHRPMFVSPHPALADATRSSIDSPAQMGDAV